MAESGHYNIDSTTDRVHVSAAGRKAAVAFRQTTWRRKTTEDMRNDGTGPSIRTAIMESAAMMGHEDKPRVSAASVLMKFYGGAWAFTRKS